MEIVDDASTSYPLEPLVRLLEHDASKDITVVFVASDTNARESRDYHRCVLQSSCEYLDGFLSDPINYYGFRLELENESMMKCAIDVFDSFYMGTVWIRPTIDTAPLYRRVYGMLYMRREFNACTRAHAELTTGCDASRAQREDIHTRKNSVSVLSPPPRITRSMNDRYRRRILRHQ